MTSFYDYLSVKKLMTRGPDHDIRKNSNGPITAYHDREASGTEEAFMTASIGAVKDIDALERLWSHRSLVSNSSQQI